MVLLYACPWLICGVAYGVQVSQCVDAATGVHVQAHATDDNFLHQHPH
jgi:hypothetical protein